MATAIVTGTSTGIGLATAVTLARAGHDVFATVRQPDRAPELQGIMRQESLPITILAMDVDRDDSVQGAMRRVLDARGRVDVLVNNAGIGIHGAIEELPLSEFKRNMETNFFGALRCIQAVLPAMREQRSGCIVNVSSVAGHIAATPQAPYAASKFALEAASEILAQEVKQFGIRVAIVEPGVINTAIFDKLPEVPAGSRYPGERRLLALFRASLEHPVSPYVVGDKIREIVEGQSRQLRHPVGPDAVGFLQWRAAMADEDWVDWGAIEDDEAWCARVQKDFGLDVRAHLKALNH